MVSDTMIKELTGIVGKENILTEKVERICYSYDASNQLYLPDIVLFPSSAKEISLILKLANLNNFPVTPRGAGSGITGGSLPIGGGVVISLERMNRILSVDENNMMAIVEPGVINGDLQAKVAGKGLFYPPDPSSMKFCTIGGNIAECAGGPRAVKYGVTRDYVLGLEVVLPSGEIINTGVGTMKGVVGYDLTRLLIGSEGTLGIVTKASLRLIPMPEAFKTMLVVFKDISDAAGSVCKITRLRITPTTIELIDRDSIRCVEDNLNTGIGDEADAVLLIELDGSREEVDRHIASLKDLFLKNNAVDVKVASGKRELKALWRLRGAISASLLKIKPNKMNEDVVVPRSRIPELITGVKSIAAKKGLTIPCFGHAGDGNIHVNVLYDALDVDETNQAKEAVESIFKLTIELGGTISGEHGVGIAKAPYISMELSQAAIDLMKEIKKTFDPKGILNPGKIFIN